MKSWSQEVAIFNTVQMSPGFEFFSKTFEAFAGPRFAHPGFHPSDFGHRCPRPGQRVEQCHGIDAFTSSDSRGAVAGLTMLDSAFKEMPMKCLDI